MKIARMFVAMIGALLLAGCTSDAPPLAPVSALAMEGQTPVTFQAPADGQISIYDLSIDNLLYSGIVRKGQLLVIDPVSKNITVNGLVANSKPLYGGDSLKILFDETK